MTKHSGYRRAPPSDSGFHHPFDTRHRPSYRTGRPIARYAFRRRCRYQYDNFDRHSKIGSTNVCQRRTATTPTVRRNGRSKASRIARPNLQRSYPRLPITSTTHFCPGNRRRNISNRRFEANSGRRHWNSAGNHTRRRQACKQIRRVARHRGRSSPGARVHTHRNKTSPGTRQIVYQRTYGTHDIDHALVGDIYGRLVVLWGVGAGGWGGGFGGYPTVCQESLRSRTGEKNVTPPIGALATRLRRTIFRSYFMVFSKGLFIFRTRTVAWTGALFFRQTNSPRLTLIFHGRPT